mmetsp:Transcript_95913/g.280342  ORF Transcript_95913/g.280342 Transcript_95913/m.280342 type:complete len:245 (+) Transcript_95913:193-927(+)
MLVQVSSRSMQWLPLQPDEDVPRMTREFLHTSGSWTRLSGAPRERQYFPPQPTHRIPSASCDLTQTSRSVMSLHCASDDRQLLPPQPMDVMPRICCDLAQMRASVIRLAGEPCSRQPSPPQPAQRPRYSLHDSTVLMSAQCMPLERQLRPFQPADGMPSHAWEFSQIVLSVMSVGDAPFSRHLLPPHPAHCRPPSLDDASSHTWGHVMSLHLLSSVRHLLPPQPMEGMPRSFQEFMQMSGSAMS